MEDQSPVPMWPVIELSSDGDDVVVDPSGVGEPIRIAKYPDSATAALTASIAAAERLQARRCRVHGTDEHGASWWMVIDTDLGALSELPAPPTSPAAAKRGPLPRFPRRWWPVAGVAAVSAIAVTVAMVLVPREALTASPVAEPTASATSVIATPPPGQLPVPAPSGWDTYAGWVVEAPMSEAAAVVVGSEALVLADRTSVFAVDPATGAELWRTSMTSPTSHLYGTSDGERVFAAQGTQTVAELDAHSGELIENAAIDASLIGLGDVPFAVLPGQAGAVLIDGAWSPRRVPAATVPVGVVGAGLVNVSIDAQQVWVTTSNDAILPAPVPLMPPADGLKLLQVVAMTNGKLVTLWADNAGGPRQVVRVEAIADNGALTAVGAPIDLTGGYASVSLDAANGLIGIGSLLLDIHTGTGVTAPTGTITARAGFGWSQSAGNDGIRLTRDGSVTPLASSAPLPDTVLPDGRAVVRAPLGIDSSAYYALTETPPVPTSAATPDESILPSPTDPAPTSTDGAQQ